MASTLAYRSETNVGSAPATPERRDRPAPIRARHIATRRQPRLTDGKVHPVTVRRIA